MREILKNTIAVLCFAITGLNIVIAKNRSIKFNGIQNINIANSGASSALNFTTDTFTIEAWVNPKGFVASVNNNEYTIVGNDSVAGGGAGYVLRTGGNRKLSFAFSYGSGWQEIVSTSAIIDTAQWQHVAVTKRGGDIKLYVNGKQNISLLLSTNFNINSSTKTFKIGDNGDALRKFKGCIDEVKIWKIARSQTEIQADMAELCGSFPVNLAAYYKLNDTGTSTINTILCANNSTLNGSISGAIVIDTGAVLYDGRAIMLYVDSTHINSTCGAQDGYSWATSFDDLNDAIEVAQINPQIEKVYVAKGSFVPTHRPYTMQATGRSTESTGNVGVTFHLRPGLELYGGFPNGGGSIPNPNLYQTILNGTVQMDTSIYFITPADTTKLSGFTFNGRRIECIKGLHSVEKCKFINTYPGINTTNATVLIKQDTFIYSRIEAASSNITINNSDIKNCLYNPAVLASLCAINITGSQISGTNEPGIYLTNCNANIDNNYIHHNRSGGIRSDYSTNYIANNVITYNKNSIPGGGILLNYGNNQILNNVIMYDTSGASGAGIYSTGNNLIVGNTISNNTTPGHISGLFCQFGRNTILKNFIANNKALSGTGGVYIQATDSPVVIANNVIANNFADYFGGMNLDAVTKGTCVNNTFYGNNTKDTQASIVAGGLKLLNTKVEVYNNIFWKNKVGGYDTLKGADIRTSGTNNFKYNSLQRASTSYISGTNGYYDLGANAIGNRFRIDPLFCNTTNLPGADGVYGSIDDGLQLSSNSPVIDSGKSTLIPSTVTDDITSRIRVYGYEVDPGAYELNCLPASVSTLTQKNICYGNSTTLQVNSYATYPNIKWYADSTSSTILDTGYYYNVPSLYTSDTFWIAATGCASGQRIPITVKVYDYTPHVQTISACDSFFWNATNKFYKTTGTYKDTLTNTWGCNSVAQLNLAIAKSSMPTVENVATCDSFLWIANNKHYYQSGIYRDTLVNIGGCDSTITLHLIIADTAKPAPQNITACDSFLWSINNKYYFSSGTYTDTFLNIGGCDSVITLNLTIVNAIASITQNGFTLQANAGASSYQWFTCNPYQPISGATSSNYTATADGDYAVVVTMNGCTDTSTCVTVTGTKVNDNRVWNSITVKPNPTTSIATLTLLSEIKHAALFVEDILGQTILSTSVNSTKVIAIDLNRYPAGMYLIIIKGDGIQYITKLIKQ